MSIAERLEHLDCEKCHEGTIKGIRSLRNTNTRSYCCSNMRIMQDHHLFLETALRDVGMHTPTTMMRMLIEWHQKIMGKDCLTETISSVSPVVDVDRKKSGDLFLR